MNYTQYKHVVDKEPFSILESPMGGYWVVTFTVSGEPIFKHSTKTLAAAEEVVGLELKLLNVLSKDALHEYKD